MNTVSVIIPLYNQGRFLKDAIQSLVKQTHQDWEAIIVNDGSTDDSAEVADSLVSSDSRVKVIHQANAGVAAARNTGLRNANGEFVALLDSDDYFLPSFFEKMMQPLMFDQKVDLAWSQPQTTNDQLLPIAPFYKKSGGVAQRYTQHLLSTRPAYRLVWNNPSVPCGELWRAKSIKSLMFSAERELSSNEDWDLNCRLEQSGGKFYHVQGSNSYYRKHGSSANMNRRKLTSSFIYCATKNYAQSGDSWIAALSRLALTLGTCHLNSADSLLQMIPGNSSEDEDTIERILCDDLLLPFASLWCGGAIRRAPAHPPDRAASAIKLLKRKLPRKFITWEIAAYRSIEKLQDYLHFQSSHS